MNIKEKSDLKQIIKNNIFMLHYISKYCPKFILVTITIGLSSSIMRLITTYYTKLIVDIMEIDVTIERLVLVTIIMVVINISISSFTNWLNAYVSNKYSFYLNYGMTLEIFDKLKTMDYECYHDTDFFNNAMKAIQQSDSRAKSVMGSINILLSSILSVSTFAVVISIFNPILFIFVAISVFSSLFFSMVKSKIQYANYNQNVRHIRRQSYVQRIHLLENYAKEIRMNKGLSYMLDKKFKIATESLINNNLKFSIKIFKINIFQLCITLTASNLITFYLGVKVIHKSIRLSDYFFINSSVGQLVNQSLCDRIVVVEGNMLYNKYTTIT